MIDFFAEPASPVINVEEEKALIDRYASQRTVLTEFWAVLRDPRPISINAAYSGLRRFLTAAGRNFEDKLKEATAFALLTQPVSWNHVVDHVYKHGGHIDLTIWLYLSDLYNPQWEVGGGMTKGGKKRKPKPRSPFRTMDGSNYIKLIEDAVVKGTGIDDSAHLDVAVKKRESRDDPRIVLSYKVLE